MIEEREFRGNWWLPETPEREVGGVATFSQDDGVQLEVFSALNPEVEAGFTSELVEHNTVLGRSTDNDRVTIQGAMYSGGKSTISRESGVRTEEYVADMLLDGAHFTDEVRFDQIDLHYPLLWKWAGRTGVTHVPAFDDDGMHESSSIEYSPPEAVTVDLDTAELGLKTGATITPAPDLSISEQTTFNIIPKSGTVTLEESQEYQSQLQDFLTLATGSELPAEKLVGRIEIERPDLDDPAFHDVDVMYQTGSDLDRPGSRRPYRWNFEFSDIEDRFETVMNEWFEKYEALNPVNQLYFSTKYNSNMYTENEFLTLTRAIEAYHRIVYGGQYLPNDEYEEYKAELAETIHDDYPIGFKDHLKDGTFEFANEYSLRKRLGLLIDKHIDTLSVLPVDIAEMSGDITDARNALTHRNQHDEIHETHDFVTLTWVARALLEVVLLSEIDIPEAQVRERIGRRYEMVLSG